MADSNNNTLQLWNLIELIGNLKRDFSRNATTGWAPTDFHIAGKRSFSQPNYTCYTVNCLCVIRDRQKFVTIHESRIGFVWQISETTIEPIYKLQGLHITHEINNVAVCIPRSRRDNKASTFRPAMGSIEKKLYTSKLDVFLKHEDYGKGDVVGNDQVRPIIKDKKQHKTHPFENVVVVVTGGMDGNIGFWPLEGDGQPPSQLYASMAHRPIPLEFSCSLQHDNSQGVTSMIVFIPKGGENTNPLLLTGSIDNFIYVWDIYTQAKLRVLTCHSNRVNCMLTYFTDNATNVLVSGSDDGSAVFWNDGLQHHLFPPSKHTIARSFYNDVLTPGCWQHIKALKATCPTLFWEFPHLFYLALIERQETFFIEFIDDLKQVITRIPGYPRSSNAKCCRWMHHVPQGPVDLLEYAMHTNALIALRAILLAWVHVLNKDIDDSLNQILLFTVCTFNERNLLELATNFPVEYMDFITSLRLVRIHRTARCVNDDLIRVIPHGKRLIVAGSNAFSTYPLDSSFKEVTLHPTRPDLQSFLQIRRRILDELPRTTIPRLASKSTLQQHILANIYAHRYCLREKFLLVRIYEAFMDFKFFIFHGKEVPKQAVMPFMIPIKRFVDLRQFRSAIQTSEALKRMDIFEADIMLAAITHYWNVQGWKIYLYGLIQYTLTIFMFVYSIYAYQQVVHKDKPHRDELRKCKAATGGFMFFMTWYMVDEVFQIAGEFIKFHKSNMTQQLGVRIILNHFLDMWNVIDCSVIVTGLLGAAGRYKEVKYCYNGPNYVSSDGMNLYFCNLPDKGAATTSCLLAATAVLLWFKVLYFLRPSKSAGQFGK
jgi:hypothetical protein